MGITRRGWSVEIMIPATETVTTTTHDPGPPISTTVAKTTVRIGFWEEEAGVYSSMRLMCFICLCAAIIFGLLAVLLNVVMGMTLAVSFLTAAMTGKVVQRLIEPK